MISVKFCFIKDGKREHIVGDLLIREPQKENFIRLKIPDLEPPKYIYVPNSLVNEAIENTPEKKSTVTLPHIFPLFENTEESHLAKTIIYNLNLHLTKKYEWEFCNTTKGPMLCLSRPKNKIILELTDIDRIKNLGINIFRKKDDFFVIPIVDAYTQLVIKGDYKIPPPHPTLLEEKTSKEEEKLRALSTIYQEKIALVNTCLPSHLCHLPNALREIVAVELMGVSESTLEALGSGATYTSPTTEPRTKPAVPTVTGTDSKDAIASCTATPRNRH